MSPILPEELTHSVGFERAKVPPVVSTKPSSDKVAAARSKFEQTMKSDVHSAKSNDIVYNQKPKVIDELPESVLEDANYDTDHMDTNTVDGCERKQGFVQDNLDAKHNDKDDNDADEFSKNRQNSESTLEDSYETTEEEPNNEIPGNDCDIDEESDGNLNDTGADTSGLAEEAVTSALDTVVKQEMDHLETLKQGDNHEQRVSDDSDQSDEIVDVVDRRSPGVCREEVLDADDEDGDDIDGFESRSDMVSTLESESGASSLINAYQQCLENALDENGDEDDDFSDGEELPELPKSQIPDVIPSNLSFESDIMQSHDSGKQNIVDVSAAIEEETETFKSAEENYGRPDDTFDEEEKMNSYEDENEDLKAANNEEFASRVGDTEAS